MPASTKSLVRTGTAAVLAFLLGVGCSKPSPFKLFSQKPRSDRKAPVDPPSSYPEWTADAPQAMKPAADLQPEPRAREEDPLNYFTNKKLVPIRQPGGYKPEEIPRVAVWYTDNNGFEWKKAGFFGMAQSYFWFEAPADGDYGVRFVGPGQEPAKVPVAEPVRVYHVDTTMPMVELIVDPNQAWYKPGQSIALHWKAQDYHLVDQPVEIGVAADFTSEHPSWVVLQKDLDASGSYTYEIPPNAAGRGLTFRAAARDRAGNLGLGYTHLIQVQDEPNQAEPGAAPQMQQTAAGANGVPGGSSAPVTLSNLNNAAPSGGASDAAAIQTLQPDTSGWTPIDSSPSASGSTPTAVDAPAGAVMPPADPATAPPSPPIDLKIEEVRPDPDHLGSSAGPEADLLFDHRTPAATERQPDVHRTTSIDAISPPVIRSSSVSEVAAPTPMTALQAEPPAPPPTSFGLPPAANPRTTPPADAASSESLAPASAAPDDALQADPALALVPTTVRPQGGLVAPLPGTAPNAPPSATNRPWQTLKKPTERKHESVWALPKPAFLNDVQGLFEMQMLSNNPDLAPAGPGADTSLPVAEADVKPRDASTPATPK